MRSNTDISETVTWGNKVINVFDMVEIHVRQLQKYSKQLLHAVQQNIHENQNVIAEWQEARTSNTCSQADISLQM